MITSEKARPLPDSARKVFTGSIFDVWQWDQELYDGGTALFERLDRPDTAHVVGVLPDETILLAYDEQPHRDAVLTPPGGAVEQGETVEEAAKREFLEETGHEIGTLVPWHQYQPSSKIDWTVHAFVGHDLKRVGDPAPEGGERIKLRTYSFDEFLALGSNPKLRDLVIRIILLEAQLDAAKRAELRQLLFG